MSDKYQAFTQSAIGKMLVKNLGLPAPTKLERYAAGDPLVRGTVLVGGRGGYLGTVAGALCLIELTTVLVGLGLRPPLVQATLGATIVVLVSIYGREPHVRQLI